MVEKNGESTPFGTFWTSPIFGPFSEATRKSMTRVFHVSQIQRPEYIFCLPNRHGSAPTPLEGLLSFWQLGPV